MKRILSAVFAMTCFIAGMAFAEAEKSVSDQPQTNSKQQVDQETANGPGEHDASELKKQQEEMKKKEEKARIEEEMRKKEWAGIGAPKNRTARLNAEKKRDRPGRHR